MMRDNSRHPCLVGVWGGALLLLALLFFGGCAGGAADSSEVGGASGDGADAETSKPLLRTAEQAADAAGAADGAAGVSTDGAGASADASSTVFSASPPAPAAYSGGACPSFTNGSNTIQSGGRSRNVEVSLPSDPSGAPVLFIYHGLGDSPQNMMGFYDASGASASEGAIVVAPGSCCGFVEWPFSSFEDATPDLTLFDDVVACLDEQFDIDNRRIYASGFSAGALWTTFLLTRRGDYLAAAVPFSGGVGTGVSYQKPGYNLPVLVVWGGVTDVYGGGAFSISFETDSLNLIENLESDGHYVARCDHGGAHTIPWGGAAWAKTFLFAHTWNDGSSPYQDSVPTGVFPDYCTFP